MPDRRGNPSERGAWRPESPGSLGPVCGDVAPGGCYSLAMLRSAFSTVACPDWTLERVVQTCVDVGFAGVELRSFGSGSTHLACDPALTHAEKVRRLFHDAGVEIAGVASGCRFDAVIHPPVIGHVLDRSMASVHEGRHLVDVAMGVGAEYLRVYAFDQPRGERRVRTLKRICERLALVVDHANKRGVRIVLENGGAFSRAEDLAEIIARVNSPLLGACYDLSAAVAAGDDPVEGVHILGPRLWAGRVKDKVGDGQPCLPGDGELPCEAFVRAMARNRWTANAWVVFSWDRMWLPDLAPASEILPDCIRRLDEWMALPRSGSVVAA